MVSFDALLVVFYVI